MTIQIGKRITKSSIEYFFSEGNFHGIVQYGEQEKLGFLFPLASSYPKLEGI
jgi:hypothetical protein